MFWICTFIASILSFTIGFATASILSAASKADDQLLGDKQYE